MIKVYTLKLLSVGVLTEVQDITASYFPTMYFVAGFQDSAPGPASKGLKHPTLNTWDQI